MTRPSPLDDPHRAAFAWARYRRLMRLMTGLTLIVVIGILAAIVWQEDDVSPHFLIAAALGVGASMLLTSALMGLVFLSSGSGHDAVVENSLDAINPQGQSGDRRKVRWKD